MTPPPLLKPYRLVPENYDNYDEMYATHMKTLTAADGRNFQPFHDFTDNLLDETHISRFQLLQAINDYRAAGIASAYPLGSVFEDAAFNYRPHQNCTIS
jgi:hypothetical protein